MVPSWHSVSGTHSYPNREKSEQLSEMTSAVDEFCEWKLRQQTSWAPGQALASAADSTFPAFPCGAEAARASMVAASRAAMTAGCWDWLAGWLQVAAGTGWLGGCRLLGLG